MRFMHELNKLRIIFVGKGSLVLNGLKHLLRN